MNDTLENERAQPWCDSTQHMGCTFIVVSCGIRNWTVSLLCPTCTFVTNTRGARSIRLVTPKVTVRRAKVTVNGKVRSLEPGLSVFSWDRLSLGVINLRRQNSPAHSPANLCQRFCHFHLEKSFSGKEAAQLLGSNSLPHIPENCGSRKGHWQIR